MAMDDQREDELEMLKRLNRLLEKLGVGTDEPKRDQDASGEDE